MFQPWAASLVILISTDPPEIRLTVEELAGFMEGGGHSSVTLTALVLDIAASLIHRTQAPFVEVLEAGRGAVVRLHADGTESHAERLGSSLRDVGWRTSEGSDWRPK